MEMERVLLKLSMLVTIMLGRRSLPSCSQWNVRGMSPSLASQVRRVLDPTKRSVGKCNGRILGGTVVILGWIAACRETDLHLVEILQKIYG